MFLKEGIISLYHYLLIQLHLEPVLPFPLRVTGQMLGCQTWLAQCQVSGLSVNGNRSDVRMSDMAGPMSGDRVIC